jgi:hypothetical protein
MRTTLISAVALAVVCGWQALAQTSACVKGVVTGSSGALVCGSRLGGARLGGLKSPIFDPFRVSPARRTATGYIRLPLPADIPAARFDAVTRSHIQAYPRDYPLPDRRFSDQSGQRSFSISIRRSLQNRFSFWWRRDSAKESAVVDSVQRLWIGGRS